MTHTSGNRFIALPAVGCVFEDAEEEAHLYETAIKSRLYQAGPARRIINRRM
jgi:hypothetical protein